MAGRDRGPVRPQPAADGGNRTAHIIDPFHATAATAVRSVTVLGPELLWADVYATAAAARGAGALEWLSTVDGYEALLVDGSGSVFATAGWPRRTAI